jgi:hypothetical protein
MAIAEDATEASLGVEEEGRHPALDHRAVTPAVTRLVLRRAVKLGFSMMLVPPSARHSAGESPSRLMVNSSSRPSRRLPAASGYSRSSQEVCV